MDVLAEGELVVGPEDTTLSYDDSVPYSELPPPPAPTHEASGQSSLAQRIGQTKVYLISETLERAGKRKYEEEEEDNDMEEDVSDPSLRDNAILLHGSPIAHLPTDNIFAYATHFDSHPIGLEWIDDTTCILVFTTKSAARAAFRVLTKSYTEEPSEEGFITAKPIPVAIWPPSKRIDSSLGVGEGLKGPIRMRWALTSDVKKRGASKASNFYRQYGASAGKGPGDEWGSNKRRRTDVGEVGESQERARLDDELDAFLAEGEIEDQPPSPPSKMRADYIDRRRGKSLLDRTAAPLESRITSPLPRRARRDAEHSLGSRIGDASSRGENRNREGRGRGHGRRNERPKVTQEDLDAELDAFLNSNA